MKVDLFPTCVIDALNPEVGVATVRVLRAQGHDVGITEAATCCGQPAWNSGHAAEAAKVARTTLAALEASEADAIVVPAGSCTTMIRVFWPELFEVVGDHAAAARATTIGQRVFEFSEFCGGGRGLSPQLRPVNRPNRRANDPPAAPVVYHRSCHMLRELRIEETPEMLLDAAGINRVEPETTGRCCGFGGLFSVKLPELSQAMADEVLDTYAATGARTIAGCDSSCLMQLQGQADRRKLGLTFKHIAELLDDPASAT